MNFKLNQKVIALTGNVSDIQQSRVKGKIYKVKAILYCCDCGGQMINLGQIKNNKIIPLCCHTEIAEKNLMWTKSIYFAPINEKSLEQAIENEEYELAAILRDELTKKEYEKL